MAYLRLPSRRSMQTPPAGSAVINGDSPQALGLYRWWPQAVAEGRGSNIRLHDVVDGDHLECIAPNETPKWGIGQRRTSLFYYDSNTHTCRSAVTPTLAPPFTLCAWQRGGVDRHSPISHDSATNNGYRLGISGSPPFLRFTLGSVADYDTSLALSTTEWNFMGVSVPAYNATATCWAYAHTLGLRSEDISIGTVSGTPNLWQAGYAASAERCPHDLGELRVYSVALGAPEIKPMVGPSTQWDLFAIARRTYFLPTAAAPAGGLPAGSLALLGVGA